MQKILLICLASLTFVLNAAGQQKTDQPAEEIQREVTFLLLNKNINDVTKKLDSESSTSVDSLLRRLVIYSRAGQISRVRKTLEQLSSTANWQCPAGYQLKWLIRHAASGDVGALRLYYEKVCPDDIDDAEGFVRLWASSSDTKEIDAWLVDRSNRNDKWLMLRVQQRTKSGTAGELLNALAAELRANPTDWTRLDRYLNANSYAGIIPDLSWLADAFEVNTAGETFRLAERVRRSSPQTGAKLLQKSLALPFTEADAKMVDELINRGRSFGPPIKVNWEKQLRYWTKRNLAETYQWMNQSLAAQPFVDELVSMKGDDILLQDVHQLAGTVQSGSGHRVVETKIIGDEVARRSTSEYWVERGRYYDGRKEYGLERDSYRQALVALAAKPDDREGLRKRRTVVWWFALFLAKEHNGKADKHEREQLLTRELNSVPPETDYAFEIARLIVQNELEADELRDSLLARRPAFLARLFDGRAEWGTTEQFLIRDVVDHEEIPSSVKEKVWSSLEPLVRDPGSTRAYHLAHAMNDSDEWQRAIPFWRGYIKHASNKADYTSDAVNKLFTAYCRTKQWQTAEKLLLSEVDSFWRDLPNALAEVALVAAQQNAIDDAMRLWRMSANLNRQNLDPLQQLAQTKAKPHLQAMYSQMKNEDPLSTIPDHALRLLQ